MTTPEQVRRRNVKIGLMITVAMGLLAAFVFFIGSEQKLFSKKYHYEVQFENAQGLAQGNPVHMSGVAIGVVQDIRLPRTAESKFVEIVISIDRKYASRIREDSRARLKKLGLIASDSYVDISPGTASKRILVPGATIPAAKQTNVDQLLGQGEDLVDNFVQISHSLKNVLDRVDRGEGVLGELTSNPDKKVRLTDTLETTLTKANTLLTNIERGRGVVGRLVSDEQYADQLLGSLHSTISSVQVITATMQKSFEDNEGALPMLMSDPEQKAKVVTLVGNLATTSQRLATLSESFEGKGGVIPRLIKDEAYADKMLKDFQELATRMNDVAKKLDDGQGTAGKIIADPAIYESINDTLIGINESSTLRWLIRHNQKKGIDERAKAEKAAMPKGTPVAEPAPPVPVEEQAPPAAIEPTPAPTPTATPEVVAPPATDTAPPTPAAEAPAEGATPPPAAETLPAEPSASEAPQTEKPPG